MKIQYFIAPIGHEIIIVDNGKILKRGKFGIFQKIGNMIYHVSERVVQKNHSEFSIPIVGEKTFLEEILKEIINQNQPLSLFHRRKNHEPVYYNNQIGLVTRMAA